MQVENLRRKLIKLIDLKQCSTCLCRLPKTEFGKQPLGKDGLNARCKGCVAAASQKKYYATREESKAKGRRTRRKHKTGWSEEDFNSMWTQQRGYCAICQQPMLPSGRSGKSATADHCHETGLKRGLPCSNCNQMLGYSHDNATTLRRAAAYLEFHHPPQFNKE